MVKYSKTNMSLDQTNYNYILPPELIANQPVSPRDSCKLLILNRQTGDIKNKIFSDITQYLSKNDVIVFNQSKVFPARLYGQKNTGGQVEVLLYHQESSFVWQCISRPGLKIGATVSFSEGLVAQVIDRDPDGETKIQFNISSPEIFDKLDQIGKIPIPPYIKPTQDQIKLKQEYQTVYASQVGSAAAPTAGLHFTPELLSTIKSLGVQMEYITLHVGLGTFQNLREENIINKKLHLEYFEIESEVASRLNQAKKDGKRIIAVGTTSTRALESAYQNGSIQSGVQSTEIFIYPPYKFKFVDALITNFHLPESSLLMLVSAFVSFPNTKNKFQNFSNSVIGNAYSSAISDKYRFFSFGDAMFIV